MLYNVYMGFEKPSSYKMDKKIWKDFGDGGIKKMD